MKISIIGTGYVGLTTGIALGYLGHQTTCIDVDEEKINRLKNGSLTIYEPWLKEVLQLARNHIHFTSTNAESVIADSEVIFITVGTPSLTDGSPDLKFVKAAAELVGENLGAEFTVVVNKSTVPIGSGNWVESLIRDAYEARNGQRPNGRCAVASNPEFLREGTALFDTFFPDRVVIGSDNRKALEVLYELYRPILEQNFSPPSFLSRPEGFAAVPLITTNLASAELIKYAANSFLALKVSFINEFSQLAERIGADISQIAKGIGLDKRIGARFLQAGLGWGGSCFGKDTSALVTTAKEYGIKMSIVEASREVNYKQRDVVIEKLLSELKILKGRSVGLLGLSFKPHTDDLRDAPSLDIARKLIDKGVKVKAHDPISIEKAAMENPDLAIQYCGDPEGVAEDSDALILVTEWPEYRNLTWKNLAKRMAHPLLVDGRNFLEREILEKSGFKYLGLGK